MIEKDRKNRTGSPRHDPVGYRIEYDLIVPKGTIFRRKGESVSVDIGFSRAHKAVVSIDKIDDALSDWFTKVIS